MSSHPSSQDRIPIRQAAEILGVSVATIRRWEKEGKLSAQKTAGGHRKFSLAEVKALADKQSMTVSQAAKELGISASSLRRFESLGLITPERNASGERRYEEHALAEFKTKKAAYDLEKERKKKESYQKPSKQPITSNEGVNKIPVGIPETNYVSPSWGKLVATAGALVMIIAVLGMSGALYARFFMGKVNNQVAYDSSKPLNIENKEEETKTEYTSSLQDSSIEKKSVLGVTKEQFDKYFEVNVPALFNGEILQARNATVTGLLTVEGELIAPNLTNTVQGQGGDVVFTAGEGIEIAGLTFTNTDTGSSQNIFKQITVGSETLEADENNDILTVAAGDNITLTTNPGTDTITIAAANGTVYEAGNDLDLDGTTFKIESELNHVDKISGLDSIDDTTASTLESALDVAGDVTGTLTSVVIGNDKILEAHLKAVDTAADEECLTYETTTGDFEWESCGTGMSSFTLAGDSGGSQTIEDGNTLTIAGGNGITTTASATDTLTIAVDLLSVADGAGATSSNSGLELTGASGNQIGLIQGCSDNQLLKWNDTTNVWYCASGTGTSAFDLTDGTTTQSIQDSDTLTLSDGSTIDFTVAATDTITAEVVADSLDFAQLQDALDIDAATTVTFGSNNFIYNLSGTGEFEIQDGGTEIFKVHNDGDVGLAGVKYTFPGSDGSSDYVLTTDGAGNLSWQDVTSVGAAGDITSVGDVTSGAAFTGTQGTTLYFNDADGDGTLTIADLTTARTWTLPDAAGTFLLSGHTFTGDVEGTAGASGTTSFTIAANAVALGTDTTGNYVATIADAGNSVITVANSGSETAAVTLDITDGGIVEDDLAASLVFDDGDLLNLSGINMSSASEGLILGQTTDCSAATAEGQTCWDSDDNALYVGDGSASQLVGGSGTSLFTDGGAITYLTSTTDDLALGGSTSSAPFFFDENEEQLNINNTTSNGALVLNQDGTGIAIQIDSEATASDVIDIASPATTTGNIIDIDADALTTGKILDLTSNSSSTSSRYLVDIRNQNSSATGATPLYVQQNAANDAIYINQQADGRALRVSTSGTTADAIAVLSPSTTTGDVFYTNPDSLTTGSAINVFSSSASTASRDLVYFRNYNRSADSATVLNLQQRGANRALFIDQDGNGIAMQIDSEGTSVDVIEITGPTTTTGNIFDVNADALTTGKILDLTSNSSSTSTRDLVNIVNDNTLATGATVLNIQQDSTGDALAIDHNAAGLSFDIDAAGNADIVNILAENTAFTNDILVLEANEEADGSFNFARFIVDADGSPSTVFAVDEDGDATIAGVAYTWPTSDAAASDYVLTSNGAGTLTWQDVTAVGGAGDITAVGSMTSGAAFADSSADDDWLGLGASAGRIAFDDQTTDYVNILNANLGVNTTTPTYTLDVSGSARFEDVIEVHGNTIGLNNDANANNLIGIAAAAGEAGSDLYWGDDLVCDVSETTCGWVSVGGSGSSLFTDGGAITYLTSTTDDLALGGSTSSAPFFFDESEEQLNINNTTSNSGLFLNQDGTGIALQIDSEATASDVIEILTPATTTGNVIDITPNSLTTGKAINVVSNSSDGSGRNLVSFTNSNAGATLTTVLQVQQNAGYIAMNVDQNANGVGLQILSEATTQPSLNIYDPKATTADVINIQNADDLTAGSIAYFRSNSSDTSTRYLVDIRNDNTLATGANVLRLQQDAANEALFIDQNGNGQAIQIDSESTSTAIIDIATSAPLTTTGSIIDVAADSLTTGNIADFSSNSSSTSTRDLVNIVNDNTLATGATVLNIQQDSTGAFLTLNDGGTDVWTFGDGGVTTLGDGASLDFSSVNMSDTTEGLHLGQTTDCSAATAEGQICWDTDDDTLYVGDGSAIANVGGASTTLQEAYDNDADGSNVIIALTSADDSLIFRNPASGGTDDAFRAFLFDIDNTTGTSRGVEIDSELGSTALYITSASDNTTSNGAAVRIIAEDSAGALNISRNVAGADLTSSHPLILVNESESTADAVVVDINNSGVGTGLVIDQRGNGIGLYLDSGATTSHAFQIIGPAQTTGNVIYVNNADALTSGRIIYAHSNSSDATSRDLITIVNDNPSATGATPLHIQQDAANDALFIDQNGNGQSIEIDTEATSANTIDIQLAQNTTGNVVDIRADTLTTGSILDLTSNSSDTSNRNLVYIYNDHTSATGAVPLRVRQDAAEIGFALQQFGNDDGIFLDHNGTTSDSIEIDTSITSGRGIYISGSALTTGTFLSLYTNGSDTSNRNLFNIRNDNALATGATLINLQQDSTGDFITLEDSGTDVFVFGDGGHFEIYNGSAPASSVGNGVILYAEDVSSSSELKVRDEAGNVTTLSPHNYSLFNPSEKNYDGITVPWSFYSYNEELGQEINVDMLGAIQAIEALAGQKFVYVNDLNTGEPVLADPHGGKLPKGLEKMITPTIEDIVGSKVENLNVISEADAIAAALNKKVNDLESRVVALEEVGTQGKEVSNDTEETSKKNPIPQPNETIIYLTEFTEAVTYLDDVSVEGDLITATAHVQDALFVHGDVNIFGSITIDGDAEIKGELSISSDQAGRASIPRGGKGVAVEFEESFFYEPVLQITAHNSSVQYQLTEVSSNGFTLELAEIAEEEVVFSWVALTTYEPKTIEGEIIDTNQNGIPDIDEKEIETEVGESEESAKNEESEAREEIEEQVPQYIPQQPTPTPSASPEPAQE